MSDGGDRRGPKPEGWRPVEWEPEQLERWDRAWEGASEFERRRFHRMPAAHKLIVMVSIPVGGATTLHEAMYKVEHAAGA
jgi:hypothetical protein